MASSPKAGSKEEARQRLILVVLTAGGVREFDLSEGTPKTVGSATASDIFLDDPSVSLQHAWLSQDGGGITVCDLGSEHGTFVRGARSPANTPVEVHLEDEIRFGTAAGQMRTASVSRLCAAQVLSPDRFDARVVEEAQRSFRYGRKFGVLAVEATDRSKGVAESLRAAVLRTLRANDAITVRAPGRLDLLVVECTKEGAVAAARRIHSSLVACAISTRMGVAVYPGDATTPESLLVVAQLTMCSTRSSEGTGVETAHEAARMLRIGTHEVVLAEPLMVRLFHFVERTAAGAMPVLITGETGTGKEIIAEAVHALGPRAARPMVRLNCAALPENLLESELFGHERGAFTGATASNPGLLEEARDGTLLLDEIGDMPLPLQAKLLRVLEDRRVRRVGATRDHLVDVRIIASTHRDLVHAVAEGHFRSDLYYRLTRVVLEVPPLRQRKREIPLLAARFAAEAAGETWGGSITVAADAMAALLAYPWPGNVRELKNVMSRAVMSCDSGELERRHLPSTVIGEVAPLAGTTEPSSEPAGDPAEPGTWLPLEDAVRAFERGRILEALHAAQGNQTRAAQLLGVPRRTLAYKLAALGIEATRPRRG